MALLRGYNPLHFWPWISLGAFSLLALPAACYPAYTFTEAEAVASASSSGSGGATTSSSPASSSSGQGGGMASSSTSMSSSTNGTGGTTGENCLNTIDDDLDGLKDCADSDCNAGYACVPAIPIGWDGYLLLFVGTPGQEPNCPAEFPSSSPYTGISGINFSPPTCDPCTCDPPMGQTCDLPDNIVVSNKACGTLPTQPRNLPVPSSWSGSCYGPSGYAGGDLTCAGPCNVSVNAPPAAVLGGSCAPQGGTPTINPVTWNAAAKGCGDADHGAGCPGAEVCQPHPPGEPFLTGLCVFKDGDNACPGGGLGPYSDWHLFYQNVTDSRDCTACNCGAPSGSSCNVSITVYSDVAVNMCNTPAVTFDAGNCGNLSGNPAVIGRSATMALLSGGSCPASGGQPTGTVTPVTPTTFCCIP